MNLIALTLFIGFPLAEIWVLMAVAGRIGFWETVLLLVLSAYFGVNLAKMQGTAVMRKVQQCLAEGRIPSGEMFDGILLFIGGVFFVIPGFITDAIGLLLIFPPTRWFIKFYLSRNAMTNFTSSRAHRTNKGFYSQESADLPQKAFTARGSVSRGEIEDAEIVEK